LFISRTAHQQDARVPADLERVLAQVCETASARDVASVIEWHLKRLGLPFDHDWLEE
jgi:hypothetical protein